MATKMPAVVNLRATLEGESKLNTLRVDLSYGFRAPIVNGEPTIQGMWRADLYEQQPQRLRTALGGQQVYRAPKRRFLGTFVTDSSKEETPADLLRQLADIYEAGELSVGGK